MKLILLLFLLQTIRMESENDFLDINLKSKNITIENCICVPYWQCKEDFSGLIEDGLNIIDIRITKPTNLDPCKGDFDVCCQVECGRRNTNLPTSFQNDTWKSRILGENNEADFAEFPWMLGIIQRNIFLCGGSLIHPKVVITAAHCVVEDETYIVRAGEWNWATKSEPLPYQERTSEKVLN
nr:coagulation factor X-like [Onthophagus taurus]